MMHSGDPQEHSSHNQPTHDSVSGDASSDGDPIVLGDGARGGRELVLTKNGHRYVFRYAEGREPEFLQSLIETVKDPNNELSWFDAAVLSHQLGEALRDQLQQLTRPA